MIRKGFLTSMKLHDFLLNTREDISELNKKIKRMSEKITKEDFNNSETGSGFCYLINDILNIALRTENRLFELLKASDRL